MPVPVKILDRLRLADALAAEAASKQSLMPSAPGWDDVVQHRAPYVDWIKSQLRAGLTTTPPLVVMARKATHGIRPVPIWGFTERIVYRALVDFILRNEPQLDRSQEAYLNFLRMPVSYARTVGDQEHPRGIFGQLFVGSTSIKYVVQADVTAFYDYVDHGILARELLVLNGDFEAIDCLSSLLMEMQGRAYGLPQLLDPSDRLSEVYVDAVERDMLRRGWPTWRYNDDFRVAVNSFTDALAAIEDLAVAARTVGLALNDLKTTTPSFITYAFENFDLRSTDELPEEVGVDTAENLVGDYTETLDDDDYNWAVDLIMAAHTPEVKDNNGSDQCGINLGRLTGDEFRRLRRAINRITRARDSVAISQMTKISIYVPSLTPSAMRYLMAAGDQDKAAAAEVLSVLTQRASLSDWQRVWLTRTIDALELHKPGAPGDSSAMLSWISKLTQGRYSSAVLAEATLTLAHSGHTDYQEVEQRLRSEPSCLAPWYLASIRSMQGEGKVAAGQYDALRARRGLYAAVLGPRK